ncbi:hypothetical protein INT48_003729 [Thamnidium elegans]|uniref:Uncharacterized protein n=1 Tax=Thamnidium elegans TaxID=101142 RepID=A0A8H7SP63_9FUNG|nr:hypothetical protein INT48_003729 [Thamnidium elegans]
MNHKSSQRKKPKQHNTCFISSPIEDRIDLYEHKYRICMQSRTELSNWIKSNKEKGVPAALTEGYSPPSRSRLFSSLSTRPTAISSLSTFLKKATSYNNKPCPPSTQHRFSLTSSLNRFSLPKNSYHNLTEKYQNEERRHRLSNPDISEPTHKSILPHSPSSIFLDKLKSKVPYETTPLPNCYLEEEDSSPPSSPSSTGSHNSPPPYTFRQYTAPINTEKKKKRSSLLITPSLSTIRLISQKSHFLKRQSMLA